MFFKIKTEELNSWIPINMNNFILFSYHCNKEIKKVILVKLNIFRIKYSLK
jgi:hypothetical protein